MTKLTPEFAKEVPLSFRPWVRARQVGKILTSVADQEYVRDLTADVEITGRNTAVVYLDSSEVVVTGILQGKYGLLGRTALESAAQTIAFAEEQLVAVAPKEI